MSEKTSVEIAFEKLHRMDELTKKDRFKSANYPWTTYIRNAEDVRTDIRVGMIAEDCSLHIGEVLECDPIEDHVSIKSMFDGVTRMCSLYHCGVVAQSSEDIAKKTALFNEGGMDAVRKLWDDEEEK